MLYLNNMSTWFESRSTMASSTLHMLNLDLVCNLIIFLLFFRSFNHKLVTCDVLDSFIHLLYNLFVVVVKGATMHRTT